MTTLVLPQRTLNGPGSIGPATAPANAAQFVARLQQVAWPHAGGTAVSLVAESSPDGVVWQTMMTATFEDAPIAASFDGTSNLANEMRIACSIVGGQQFRLNWNFAKALTVSGSVTVL